MSGSLSLKVLFGEYVKSFQFKMGKTWCIIWLPPPSLLHKIIIRLHIINIIFISSRIKSKAEQKQFASCYCNNCVCRVYLRTVLLCYKVYRETNHTHTSQNELSMLDTDLKEVSLALFHPNAERAEWRTNALIELTMHKLLLFHIVRTNCKK